MEESVTVGGRPVVDVTSTTGVWRSPRKHLDAIPRGRDPAERVCDGARSHAGVVDAAAAPWRTPETSVYGVLSGESFQVEGMKRLTMGADLDTAIYFNDGALEEVQVKSSGNDAEVSYQLRWS